MNINWLEKTFGPLTLDCLVGDGVLTGVDFGSRTLNGWHEGETANTVSFTLNGVTYTATEDPDDGYRSSMGELSVSTEPLKNNFAPVKVVCQKMGDVPGYYGETNDVLEIVDAITGQTILSVGTGNTSDYYPYWVAQFNPAAMAINSNQTFTV